MRKLTKKGLTIFGKEIIPDEKYVSLEDYRKLQAKNDRLRKALEYGIKDMQDYSDNSGYLMKATKSEFERWILLFRQALSTTEEE